MSIEKFSHASSFDQKSSGSYYTPYSIVKYLVDNTVGKLLGKCHKPKDIEKLKILDPACGSGIFLVYVYEVICKWYIEHDIEIPDTIITNNIFGIDINPINVELTKLVLSLKAVENTKKILDLSNNIKCGNSLISPEIKESRCFIFEDDNFSENSETDCFDWEKEFSNVVNSGGFSVIVGNPPWEKIKTSKREFYIPFREEIKGLQGTSLDIYIMELEEKYPNLAKDFEKHKEKLHRITNYLSDEKNYKHQSIKINGRKTGGDPDLFQYFIERAYQYVRPNGMVGYLVPCTLWQAESTTALRKLLFEKCTMESLYTFENYRKWAFNISSRFKFTMLVFNKARPPKDHEFPAAFMLRDPSALVGKQPERVLSLSRDFVEQTSPGTLALLDIKSDSERKVIEKLYGQKHLKPLGDPANGWDVKYRAELHMANDAWLFKSRDWMERHGFTQVLPVHGEDGSWTQNLKGPGSVAGVPNKLPPGGEYWVAASKNFYEGRTYEKRESIIKGELKTWYIHTDDLKIVNKKGSRFTEDHFRIFPGAHYTALYEGRMIHNFDHAQKEYVGGEGRKAIWKAIKLDDKRLGSRVFVCKEEATSTAPYRIGFCDVTCATNERTSLGAPVGPPNTAGNKVPFLILPEINHMLHMTALFNSFVYDYLIRMRVNTSMTWNFVSIIPCPNQNVLGNYKKDIQEKVLCLSCTTPELTTYWNEIFPDNPWTYDSAERDPWERAKLRAELDAIVAEAYGLTVPEYARILTTFPLLDKSFEALPGDLFLTEGSEKTPENNRVLGSDGSIWESKPRSFITRDFALLTYIRRKQQLIPERLDDWYRDEVGLDTEGPLSYFRIGEIKDLEARVEEAKKLGSVPYVPTIKSYY